METATAVQITPQPTSLVTRFAQRYSVDPKKLLSTLKSTAFKQQPDRQSGQLVEVSDEEMMSLLIVAERYNLDPFTKQIYAFRDRKRGGIVPIVGVDGWIQIVNDCKEFNGVTFETHTTADGKLEWVECTMHRKDREHATTVREYLRENKRDTDAWTGMPNRMLRHRAFIQCGRIAFGLTGIYDEDEGRAIIEGTATVVRETATVSDLNEEIRAKAAPVKEAPAAKDQKPAPAFDLDGDPQPGPTYAEVRSRLDAAKTADDVDLAESLVDGLPQQFRAELHEYAGKRRDAIEAATRG